MKMYRLDKGANRITDTMKGLHEDAKENSGSIDEMLSKFEKNQLRRQGGSNAESTQEPTPNNEISDFKKKEIEIVIKFLIFVDDVEFVNLFIKNGLLKLDKSLIIELKDYARNNNKILKLL